MGDIHGAPDDTVAWITVDHMTTLGIYRDGSWWTDADVDETGVAGHRHDPEYVRVLRVLVTSSKPERRPE